MSDHEFEKQVQRKLGELKLRPSDAVWTEVEKNIRHNKRRRRFIFWLPVFFFFLATSGYVVYRTNQTAAPIAQSIPAAKTNSTASATNKNAYNENKSTPPVASIAPTNDTRSTTVVAKTDAPLEQTAGTGQRQQPVAIPDQKNRQVVTFPEPAEQPAVIAAWPDAPVKRTAKKTTSKRNRNKQVPVTPDNLAGLVEEYNTVNRNTFAEQPHELAVAMPRRVPQEEGAIATGQAVPDPFSGATAALLMPEKQNSPIALPVPAIQKQKGPKWQWGVQINAGYSRISTSSLLDLRGLWGAQEQNKAENLAFSGLQNSPSNGGAQLNTAPPVKEAAPIQPDWAYSAGAYVQKPLSKRLRLTIGLQYTYMSTNTTIGKLVARTTNVNYGSTGSTVVDQYYTSAGYQRDMTLTAGFSPNAAISDSIMIFQKFRYRFHAIELPVTINWQINKGRRLPPFVVDAGFSLLHLQSIGALHYDGIKDIYYKDNSLFNKTQLNAIMGLNVGLFQRSKLPVWIGPSLRYSLTGLVKKDVSKGQFLWSAGMNVRVGLNRLF
jgi:hypothetical protein